MNEQRYRSTAGPALASMDNWNAQQNRRPVMLTDSERAAVEPEPGLDELLDSVHPKAVLWTAIDPTGGYAASVRFPKVNGELVTIPATGPTRMDAIRAAVRQATGAEGSE